ncbi:MAG: hypothetical protein V3V10_06130 [Planctomycetota bacterium]
MSGKPKPTWRQNSNWGRTTEVYAAPKEKPEADLPDWEQLQLLTVHSNWAVA